MCTIQEAIVKGLSGCTLEKNLKMYVFCERVRCMCVSMYAVNMCMKVSMCAKSVHIHGMDAGKDFPKYVT